jgi:hypothetical protein
MGDQGRERVFVALPSLAMVFAEAAECTVCAAAFRFFTTGTAGFLDCPLMWQLGVFELRA